MCLAMDSYPWMMMATTRPHPHPNPPLHPTMEEGQSHATAIAKAPACIEKPTAFFKVNLAKFLTIYLQKDQGHMKGDEK